MISALERVGLLPGGQRTLEQQVPHVLDRAPLRELDRVVLAVVVEAFEAADVADRRLGDDDAFEAAGHVGREVLGGLDLRDAHEVAHRHHADEPLAVDDRDVPVPVLGEARERGGGVEVGRDAVGVGGHPGAHRVDGGIGTRRRQAHEVAFGEDADGALAVDHDDRADALLPHARRRPGDGLGLRCGHHRPAHDLGHQHCSALRRQPVVACDNIPLDVQRTPCETPDDVR